MSERTVTILIGRLRRRRGRNDTDPDAGWGGFGVVPSTAVAAAAVGGAGGATPPGAPAPPYAGVPGAVVEARGLFAARRLQAALDSGDTEQLVAALEELHVG